MKTLLNFLCASLFLFLISCGDEVEIIPNTSDFMEKPQISAALDTSGIKADSKFVGAKIEPMYTKFGILINGTGELDINEFNETLKLEDKGASIVSIDLYIDETGSLKKMQFEKDIDKDMQKNIAKAFSKLKFIPAENEGRKVKSKLGVLLGTFINSSNNILTWMYVEKGKEFQAMAANMPEPIGGLKALQEKIIYPEIAKRAGIEGRVYVKAYIDQKGNVSQAEVLKGIGNGCDEAAVEAVMASKFTPGRNEKGEPVNVQISIPFLFSLANGEKK
ncbi:MAG TPA: energy transducer TonB [Ignavibacteriales bacterium]|nr:energy transducer TonB [Ignavibacteriales bacterium]